MSSRNRSNPKGNNNTNSSNSDGKTQIILAVIGLIGIIVTGVISIINTNITVGTPITSTQTAEARFKTETAIIAANQVTPMAAITQNNTPTTTIAVETPTPQSIAIYENNFTNSFGKEWTTGNPSTVLTTTLLPNNRGFFGPYYENGDLYLTLNDIPSHSSVSISFRLLLMGTWDGNGGPGITRDLWSLTLIGAPEDEGLITTFSNTSLNQSYPENYSKGDNFPGTGVAYDDYSIPYDLYTTYNINKVFTHSSSQIKFRFWSQNRFGEKKRAVGYY